MDHDKESSRDSREDMVCARVYNVCASTSVCPIIAGARTIECSLNRLLISLSTINSCAVSDWVSQRDSYTCHTCTVALVKKIGTRT